MQKEILNDNTDITANSQQIELLKKNFPQCFDKDGNFIIHKMEEIVGESGVELSKESYSLNWLGKSYARFLANENPRMLLKEVKEHNTKEQNKESQNLLIKGDNLEVLKHLSNAYAESIKMIYIDPPYNTGSDGFVYSDDRKFRPEELSRLAGIEIDEAKRILEFTQSSANSHSAWLTFMYPRLYVARHLLKDDGVIFISIDDNEQAQLKLLCDEIFGEENFVAALPTIMNLKGNNDEYGFSGTHEYTIVYVKNKENTRLGEFKIADDELEEWKEDEKGYYKHGANLKATGGNAPREKRPNLFFPVFIDDNDTVYVAENNQPPKSYTGNLVTLYPITNNKEMSWRWSKDKIRRESTEIIVSRNGSIGIYKKQRPSIGEMPSKKPKSIFYKPQYSSGNGIKSIKDLFNERLFSNPKPIELIKDFIVIGTQEKDKNIILDFFAGSGTTAHAVMQLNAEDGGNREFITVQIPEETDEKSEAYKAGYKTIFDITKARIEKAAVKIATENPDYKGDLGFKIYETIPVWDGYLDDIEELQEETTLFDGSKLSDEELEVLLTTWKVHDGMELSHELSKIDLAGYEACLGNETLYFVHSGFSTEALKKLIEKLDSDKTFEPSRVVMFGYNFASKHQRELEEALSSYANKKSIELDLIVRY
ncbi:MAG: site-specific DNA-methyltransferase [Epsilonproteobacteria bacterium]|nr:site-specific DNA-methyltransferase [Campylobacterota bacterium]